jgi:signal transduction histidine kinase
MQETRLRVLLIEDDEDDYVVFRDLLCQTASAEFELDWARSYDEARREIAQARHDVYFIDYRLGDHDGMELLRELTRNDCRTPVIFLTGLEDYSVDTMAMKLGAVDYLVKNQVTGSLIERSMRYALERRRVEDAFRKSEQQLRYLSFKLLHVQEDERTHLAQRLHDSTGQTLAAIKLAVENAVRATEDGDLMQISKCLAPIAGMIQDAINEVRRLYMDLRPTVLDDFGISAALGWLTREFTELCPKIHLERQFNLDEQCIPEPLKIVIYRVVQEAFKNLAEHSQARTACLTLNRNKGVIELIITDDGQGFDVAKVFSLECCKQGLGLASMRERVNFSGGSFSVESSLGKGTRVSARWPDATSSSGVPQLSSASELF